MSEGAHNHQREHFREEQSPTQPPAQKARGAGTLLTSQPQSPPPPAQEPAAERGPPAHRMPRAPEGTDACERAKHSKGQGRQIWGQAAGRALPPRGPRSLLDAQTAAAKPQGKKKKSPFTAWVWPNMLLGTFQGVQETSSCPGDLPEDTQKISACPGAPSGRCRGFAGRQRAPAGSWGRRLPRDGGLSTSAGGWLQQCPSCVLPAQ